MTWKILIILNCSNLALPNSSHFSIMMIMMMMISKIMMIMILKILIILNYSNLAPPNSSHFSSRSSTLSGSSSLSPLRWIFFHYYRLLMNSIDYQQVTIMVIMRMILMMRMIFFILKISLIFYFFIF